MFDDTMYIPKGKCKEAELRLDCLIVCASGHLSCSTIIEKLLCENYCMNWKTKRYRFVLAKLIHRQMKQADPAMVSCSDLLENDIECVY